jgi:hypothetical protein
VGVQKATHLKLCIGRLDLPVAQVLSDVIETLHVLQIEKHFPEHRDAYLVRNARLRFFVGGSQK